MSEAYVVIYCETNVIDYMDGARRVFSNRLAAEQYAAKRHAETSTQHPSRRYFVAQLVSRMETAQPVLPPVNIVRMDEEDPF